MKKKLEAELISIAHRILKLKNKSDLVQLHQETQRLYEKLSVLRFVEEHLADVKPTIGYTQIEDKLAVIFDSEVPAEIPTAEPAKQETISEIVSGVEENAAKQESVEQPDEVSAPESAQAESVTASPEVQESTEAVVSKEEDQPAEEVESDAKLEEQAAPETASEVNENEVEAETSETAQEYNAPAELSNEEPAVTASDDIPATDKPIESNNSEPAKPAFKPAFEWGFEPKSEDKPTEPKTEESKPTDAKIAPAQMAFDDLLGQDYVDPVFVKPEEIHTPMRADASAENERRAAELAESNRRLAELRGEAPKATPEVPEQRQNVIPISRNFVDTSTVIPINKENLNDRMSKGITIGLNDRIAFMKHLFNNSSEDYNRVLSQLITFGSLDEAKSFIDQIVKPDYNNWEGKDEYAERFMEIVEKKFS